MATTNDITGDKIQTKEVSEQYRNNYDLIFRKNKQASTRCDAGLPNRVDMGSTPCGRSI